MAYKCRICGVNDVEHQGDVCEFCALDDDSFFHENRKENGKSPFGPQAGTADDTPFYDNQEKQKSPFPKNRKNKDNLDEWNSTFPEKPEERESSPDNPWKHDNTEKQPTFSDVPSNGKDSQREKRSLHICKGVAKNINTDEDEHGFIYKLFRSIFKGTPISFEKSMTTFQVYPDVMGNSRTTGGYACDQVVIYGKIKKGTVSENNEIEVYGYRDRDNNVIATKILNVASGSMIKMYTNIPPSISWMFIVTIIMALIMFVSSYGYLGIMWLFIATILFFSFPVLFKVFLVILGILIMLMIMF